MRILFGALAALLLIAPGADAATLTANASNWWSVIRSANGAAGDVVQLQPDNYGAATLVFPVMQYAAPGITVQPAPGANVQVPSLSIAASNLTVKGLEVLLAPSTQYGVEVEQSANITVSGLRIHQADNATLSGTGVFVRNSTGVKVSGNEVSWVGDGIDSLDTRTLSVTGNTLHDLNSNGTFHGGVSTALIDGNSFRCFHTAGGSHPDAIQISAGTARSSNVTITNNLAETGICDVIQGFTGEDIDGLVYAGNANLGIGGDGVMCARCNNDAIDDNLVQIYPGGGAPILVRQASDNVALTNNWAAVYVGVSSDATQPTHVTKSNNTTPATASGPGDYAVFNAWSAQKAAHPIPAMRQALGGAVSSAPSSPAPVPSAPAPDPLQAALDMAAAQVATLQQQAAALTTQLQAATAAQLASAGQVATLQGQVTSLQTQLAAAQASATATQVRTLQTQLTAAQAKISKAKTDAAKVATDLQ